MRCESGTAKHFVIAEQVHSVEPSESGMIVRIVPVISNPDIMPPPPPPPHTRTEEGNGEGGCPPPCGPDTEQRNRDSPGAPLAQPPKAREGDVGR